ncbi:MAG: hypothetical protein HQL76_16005 [Magnetococcales bacterium]|nr:hypothetical protein [Magnetococcales bacterium]
MERQASIEELTSHLERLTRIVEASERRHRSMVRSLRWLGVTMGSLAILMVVFVGNGVSQAIAEVHQGPGGKIESFLEKVEGLLTHLMQEKKTIGGLIHNLASLTEWANERVHNPQVIHVTQEMVNLGLRIKQDSDLMRGMIYTSSSPLDRQNVRQWQSLTPEQLDDPLASPAVAAHQISGSVAGSLNAMVWSMDSTAGRMGRAWSWMPMP